MVSTLEHPLMGAYDWFVHVYPRLLKEYARLGHSAFFEGPPSANLPAKSAKGKGKVKSSKARSSERRRNKDRRERMQRQKERGQAYRAAADEDEDRGYDDWEKEKDQEEEEEEEEHTPSLQQCVQGSGEVVYLPAGWKHLTVNVGEAIGVGGQAPYDETERLRDALTALDQDPDDLLALKGAALGLAHRGMALVEQQRRAGGAGRVTGGGANHHHNPTNQQQAQEQAARALEGALDYLRRAKELSPSIRASR